MLHMYRGVMFVVSLRASLLMWSWVWSYMMSMYESTFSGEDTKEVARCGTVHALQLWV